jgi:beta-mannosidase
MPRSLPRLLALLSQLSVLSGGAAAAAGRAADLAGPWRYLPYDGPGDLAAPAVDDRAWPAMTLPSSWYLMGERLYPARGGGLDYQGTVWFRRTVEWSGPGAGPAVLDLDMVDYYADVFVNGTAVGHHEGYFQRWSVDVSQALRKGKNLIALKVSAPALAYDPAEQYAIGWPRMQNQVKGIFACHDTRPGATSARGQERGTGGVLRGLALRESSGVDLVELKVTPLDVSEASARLVVEAVVRNWGKHDVAATLAGTIRPKNFSGDTRLPVTFAVRATTGLSRSRGEVKIEKPALWWSWDYGRPNLYQLDAELRGPGGGALDARLAAFGVRSITRDGRWVFRLNGQRIYPRGSNYIATQWLSQADRAFYERDVKLMIAANLNSIRVHAHLERPELYEAADEMGMMIWQDFPLQWGYTDEPAFHDEATRQAADMLDRYYDHPSIVVWCMHDESPHAMTSVKKRNADQNRALDDALAALVAKGDPARIAHRDSGTGDAHTAWGWSMGRIGDLPAHMPKEPLVTAYGAQALPALETLRSMFDEEAVWPDTPLDWEAWKFSDFQAAQTFDVARVKAGKNIQEFVAASQRYQANLLRYETEVLRRAKWTSNTGLYQLMFVDGWPSITSSVLDYYRRPKLGYAALRDSMQRLLPSIEYTIHEPNGPVSLWIVNDHLTPFGKARLKWKITDPKGGTPAVQSRMVDIPPDAVIKVTDLGGLPRVGAGAARLDVWIEDAGGAFLARSSLTADDYLPGR